MAGDAERFAKDVTVADGYVLLSHSELPSIAVAEVLQRAIEGALEESGHRALLIDTRSMPSPPEDARESMWTWTKQHPEIAIAIVVHSELKRVTANMTAVSRNVRLRSFHDLGEAVSWLKRVATHSS
jgi:hypothetical protein